jgi:acetyl esterase/lipase
MATEKGPDARVTLEIAGLGIPLYSPWAAKHIAKSDRYLRTQDWEPAAVLEHVRVGGLVGFNVGSAMSSMHGSATIWNSPAGSRRSASTTGPSTSSSLMSQKSDLKRGSPQAPESQLLGGPTLDHKDLAVQACPLTHITKDDPPSLIVHGEKDNRVPLEQAGALRDALQSAGIEATIHIVEGAGHGFNAVQSAKAIPTVTAFFARHLKGK